MLLVMFEHDERLARWFAANGKVVTLRQAAAIDVGPEAMQRRCVRLGPLADAALRRAG